MLPGSFRPPVTLTGRRVRLLPLALSHVPDLARAAHDPEVTRYLFHSPGRTPSECEQYVRTILAEQAAGLVLAFVVTEAGAGRVLGATRFLNIDRENDSVEVGTWLDSAVWRAGVNRETKYLLLRHAFETEEAHRVAFQTDIRNVRSQEALARLGATREGIVRDDRHLSAGRYSSSVVYSILADEWPRVRARLGPTP